MIADRPAHTAVAFCSVALSGFDAAEQANALTNSIRELGSPSRAASEQNYLKSSREFSGTPVPAIRSVVRTWQHSTGRLAAAELIGVVRALWAGPVFECRLAAVILLERNTATLTPANIGLLEELLRTSRTWALICSW